MAISRRAASRSAPWSSEQLLPFGGGGGVPWRPEASGLQVALETVGDEKPGRSALAAGDGSAFTVDVVAGSGELGGPPWCSPGQLAGLSGQVGAPA